MMTLLTYIGFIIILFALFLTFRRCFSTQKRELSRKILSIFRKLCEFVHSFGTLSYDRSVKILESKGGTFFIPKKFLLHNRDVLLTSDPANVHHIMSTSFCKYPKGMEWRKRFDMFGDSLFNSDFVGWKFHRAFIKGFLNHRKFYEQMPKIYEDSMEKQLIPILEHVSEQDVLVDLEDVLGNHIFYISCRIITGCDLGSFPTASTREHDVFSKSIVDACEAIHSRYVLPEVIWKLQKWLGLGNEKRLREGWRTLYHLISEYVSVKRKQVMMSSRLRKEEDPTDFSVLQLLLTRDELAVVAGPLLTSDKVIRDNILAFMFAAHDTTSTVLSWFFWLLSKHPVVEKKIREEIQKYLPENCREIRKWVAFGGKELDKMVYLHAALCETLRLYPPVPSQSRTAVQHDTLPSGHKVSPKTMIVMSTYAMGRMSSVWGEDCHEFKPERWITEEGGIKDEAAHKFFAFNAGPRSCPGKDMAFTLMKAIVSAILHNYHVHVVENHQVTPKPSIILHMNHRLMVTVKKRSSILADS